VGRHARTTLARDARAVAGTATAAGRRLRPDPAPLAHDGAHALATETATAVPAATPSLPAAVPSVMAAAPPMVLAPPVMTGNGGNGAAAPTARGADDRDGTAAPPAGEDRSGGAAPVPGVAAVAVAERDVAGPLPAPAPGHGGGGGTPAQRRRRPLPARARQPDRPGGAAVRSASVPGAAPTATPAHAAPQRRPRRDGVVVPLRVPWTARLRATAGLVVMVACLGSATAVVIAALAVAASRALGQF
jgi:hypothetical protein